MLWRSIRQETFMFQRVACLAAALIVFVPQLVSAQEVPLSEILVRLIQNEVVLAGPPPGSPFASHAAHFVPGEDAQLTPYLFNQAIVSQLATYPLGSSSGGFTYTFDSSLGTYARSTNSFGPSFAERALTIGRGRWNTGASYQHASYSSFEGKNLDDRSIRFYLTHEDCCNDAFFEGDLIETALAMELKADTFAFFVNYGVTDSLDVGVAVPILHVSLDASVEATVQRLATATAPTIHAFENGATSEIITDNGSATGIGDIAIRAKYHFLKGGGGGLAVGFDLRTPTGDADNLLGTGATQGKILLIGSTERRMFAPHFNIGYTFSGDSGNEFINVTDEFNYVFGTEFVAHPKVTVAFDLVGRQFRDSGRLVETAKTFNFVTAPPASVPGSATFNEFAQENGSLNNVIGAIGAKFNPAPNLLISANILFPFTDAGIRSNIVPVIGFDYSF
jgi:hypothetical protein